MSKDFDNFVEELQNQIFEQTREDYGDVAFQRWLKPLYMGVMDNPDGYGRITGSCGDTIQIFLKFENEKVKKALFQTDGCGSSAVCGSFAAELAAFFKIPAMVCINKFDLNPDEGEAIEAFAKQRNIKVMGRIPFDPAFTRAMVQGKTIVEFDGNSEGCEAVKKIWENLVQRLEL